MSYPQVLSAGPIRRSYPQITPAGPTHRSHPQALPPDHIRRSHPLAVPAGPSRGQPAGPAATHPRAASARGTAVIGSPSSVRRHRFAFTGSPSPVRLHRFALTASPSPARPHAHGAHEFSRWRNRQLILWSGSDRFEQHRVQRPHPRQQPDRLARSRSVQLHLFTGWHGRWRLARGHVVVQRPQQRLLQPRAHCRVGGTRPAWPRCVTHCEDCAASTSGRQGKTQQLSVERDLAGILLHPPRKSRAHGACRQIDLAPVIGRRAAGQTEQQNHAQRQRPPSQHPPPALASRRARQSIGPLRQARASRRRGGHQQPPLRYRRPAGSPLLRPGEQGRNRYAPARARPSQPSKSSHLYPLPGPRNIARKCHLTQAGAVRPGYCFEGYFRYCCCHRLKSPPISTIIRNVP